MSKRRRQRALEERDSILKYIVTACMVCAITTFLIYRKISAPHTGGMPNLFWEEIALNRSRGVVLRETQRGFIDRSESAKSKRDYRNRLVRTKQRTGISRIDTCNTETRHSSIGTALFPCTHFMNLTGSMGRTGNQMFQMAALLGTAYKHGYTPIIRRSFPLTRWFKLPNLVDIWPMNSKRFSLKKCGTFSTDIDHLDHSTNWSLHGYFQSWKFFRGAEHIIRDAFKLKDKYVNGANEFLWNVSKPGQPNVCIHVRRGDLNTDDLLHRGFTIPGLDYIYKAMDLFRTQYGKNIQFIVLSDGMVWCMDHIQGNDVIFSPFLDTAEDMALMTLCDHVIVTSGTFGWWGAWLSGGQTVYYRGYPSENSWLSSQLNASDYYPPEWIGLW